MMGASTLPASQVTAGTRKGARASRGTTAITGTRIARPASLSGPISATAHTHATATTSRPATCRGRIRPDSGSALPIRSPRVALLAASRPAVAEVRTRTAVTITIGSTCTEVSSPTLLNIPTVFSISKKGEASAPPSSADGAEATRASVVHSRKAMTQTCHRPAPARRSIASSRCRSETTCFTAENTRKPEMTMASPHIAVSSQPASCAVFVTCSRARPSTKTRPGSPKAAATVVSAPVTTAVAAMVKAHPAYNPRWRTTSRVDRWIISRALMGAPPDR